MDEPGIGVLPGVAVVEPVNVRKQHQKLRPNTGRDSGGESVIVANLDLLCGDGVVFADDGQDPQGQKPLQGIMEVGFPVGVLSVRTGDQQLCHRVAIPGEQLVVGVHQFALANGGSGLLGGNIPGTLRQVELAHAHGNGTGGDQNDLVPGVFQIAEDLAKTFDPGNVQSAGGMGQRGGADLDNDSHSFPFSYLTGNMERPYAPSREWKVWATEAMRPKGASRPALLRNARKEGSLLVRFSS